MSGYIGKSQGVTQVDGYTRSEADAEYVNDPNAALNISSSASANSAIIDSSGNLLVGKTSSGLGTAGFEVFSTGQAYNTASDDAPLRINRLTSDGEIINFRKDGTTVGSIGSQGGNKLYVGSGDAGIIFDPVDDSLYPYNTSTLANRDASVDIGDAGVRFKNLYLSGGVYLGGTGSANYLDDYEEGTWTVNFYDALTGGNASSSTCTGYYTKIGDTVHISFSEYNLLADNGVSGAICFSLPFPTQGYSEVGQINVRQFAFPAYVQYLAPQIGGYANSRCAIQMVRTGNTSIELLWSYIVSGTTDIGSLSLTYRTYI